MVEKSVREDLIRLGFDLLDDQDKQLSLASLDQTDSRLRVGDPKEPQRSLNVGSRLSGHTRGSAGLD